MTLSLVIYTAGYCVTNNHRTDLNKISAYECGYSPNSHESNQYNANFIIICLLFLLIDLEILFLVPFLYTVDSIDTTTWNIFIYCMCTIIGGIIFELLTSSFGKLGKIIKQNK
ncbi:NADH-ubiquinone oxidoreductase chain 3 (mitochondrion) [Fonticula alba]|uniref:NADH-ubiquinone oxidoreductase chain 3 n=1 Tax=Fonticula alba TaxID=691883 RepID=A0A058YYU4_FONAL|nr:NADH-ubiquinone oxidoreductase chain 3 [Fonticula alba]KCV67180.1 NADH-ubiquinone oxidoreductase chain 3 [Fonticula alba]|eukprot:XP_009498414.1 NADH-ubiquinone oxidoreductase chain 3 (mitochondrion) [Fonticula alba]